MYCLMVLPIFPPICEECQQWGQIWSVPGRPHWYYPIISYLKQTNSVALSPRANYTDWATAICRRNLVPTFVGRGVSRGQHGGSPTVDNISFLYRNFTSIWTYLFQKDIGQNLVWNWQRWYRTIITTFRFVTLRVNWHKGGLLPTGRWTGTKVDSLQQRGELAQRWTPSNRDVFLFRKEEWVYRSQLLIF
jgi:hypothetical protein